MRFILRWRGREISRQLYDACVLSIPLIIFAMGIVITMSLLEFSWHMRLVLGQDELVPAFSLVLTLRETAPVVVAMLLSSRLGAAYAAEIAVMKTTEQLDALGSLGISSFEFLFLPRLVGSVGATLILTTLSIWVTLGFGALASSWGLGYQIEEFFNVSFVFARATDFVVCMVKALVFGVVIAVNGFLCGVRSLPGSQGVGQASTRSMVQSSLSIIIADFIINALWRML